MTGYLVVEPLRRRPARGPAVGADLRTTLRPGIPVTPPPPWVAEPAWVQVADRGAQVGVPGGRPGVVHLAQAELAMEDVPADQPVILLHLVRADHLPVPDRPISAGLGAPPAPQHFWSISLPPISQHEPGGPPSRRVT